MFSLDRVPGWPSEKGNNPADQESLSHGISPGLTACWQHKMQILGTIPRRTWSCLAGWIVAAIGY